MDLSRFLRILADKPLILHAADYDLRMLRSSLGFGPSREVFDTMLAAQLLGCEQLGLTAAIEGFLGVTITTHGQKSDWSQRSLTQEQLEYACDDVRYLEPLADRLLEELRGLGRADWHREACHRMVLASARDRQRDPEDAWRVKGLKGLARHQLAFVREIWRWREHEAQKADRPPFKVLGNRELVTLAVWAAAHPTGPLAGERCPLRAGPKLPRNCTGHRLHALEKAIRKAHELPKSDWPGYRKRPQPLPSQPNSQGRVGVLMAECARVAAALGIDPAVLAPRATLEAVARAQPRTLDDLLAASPMMRWQADVLGPAILAIVKPTRGHHPRPS
jgi:ribonuclease D